MIKTKGFFMSRVNGKRLDGPIVDHVVDIDFQYGLVFDCVEKYAI